MVYNVKDRNEEGAFHMPNRFILSILVVAAGLAVSPVVLAQTPARPGPGTVGAQNAPTTPDLSGVWSPAPGSRRGFGDVKDVPPMLPGAEAKFKAAREGVTDPYEQEIGRASCRERVYVLV